MRWIEKRPAPVSLTAWQAQNRGIDPNYGYDLMRLDHDVTQDVTASLVEEQGWLDAYTGQRIEIGGCHIEHVVAQAHSIHGQDVDYQSMVRRRTPAKPRMAHIKKPIGHHRLTGTCLFRRW